MKINCIGNEAEVSERLRVYRDAGVNTFSANVEGATVRERLTNLERLMALVAELNAEPTN